MMNIDDFVFYFHFVSPNSKGGSRGRGSIHAPVVMRVQYFLRVVVGVIPRSLIKRCQLLTELLKVSELPTSP